MKKEQTREQLHEEVKRLQEEKLYFRSVAKHAPNVILIADTGGTIKYINRIIPGISETIDDTTGKSIYDFMEQEYIDRTKSVIAGVLETGKSDSYEVVVDTPGGPAWFETKVGLISEEGFPEALLLITTDVTKYRKSELALMESESLFKAAFNSATDGILIADIESKKFILANNSICEMLQYSREEFFNLGVEDIHPAESLKYVGEQFARQARGEIKLASDLPVKKKDGSVFYADINSAPIELRGKRCLLGVFRDTTENKIAADKLKKREMELTERVKELNCLYMVSKLIDNPNNPVESVFTKTADIISSSMQYAEIACSRVTLGNDEYGTRNFRETEWRLTEEFKSPEGLNGRVEVCYLEDRAFLEEEVALLKTVAREIRDFLKRKKAEQAHRELEAQKMVVEELKELDRMKNEFVETVTHELRTPMTPLRSSTEMLIDGTLGEITPDQRKYLEMMKKNIDRLTRFTTEVLTFSRLESGNYVIRPGDISTISIARDVVSLLSEKAARKNSTVEVEILTESFAYADPDAVSEILTNLINNAIVHNPEGTTIKVSIRRNEEGLIEVNVQDDGKGISEEARERIFDKFFQVEREYGPGYKGTGIGLAVCKKLVEAMNGKIRVESEKGKGTKFTFTLPASQPE